jgi:hypothetical protein
MSAARTSIKSWTPPKAKRSNWIGTLPSYVDRVMVTDSVTLVVRMKTGFASLKPKNGSCRKKSPNAK